MFHLEMLQANEGDSLLLHYGDRAKPSHIVVDTGRKATWPALKRRLEAIIERGETLELLVITHIDRDHIEGVLELMKAEPVAKAFRDIWFNGFHHLLNQRVEGFGAIQGEALTNAIVTLRLPWNRNAAWRSGPVVVAHADEPPTITLDSGLKITLLSPSLDQLTDLKKEWRAACEAEGLVPGAAVIGRLERPGLEHFGRIDVERLAASAFAEDGAAPNGSSIAFIAEYDGQCVLLGADAHPAQLIEALGSLGKPKLQALKLPHHGSKANVSVGLLQAVECSRYLVSTSGSYFKHPDREAMARVIKRGGSKPELIFNYASDENVVWRDRGLQDRFDYRASYPAAGMDSVIVELDH